MKTWNSERLRVQPGGARRCAAVLEGRRTFGLWQLISPIGVGIRKLSEEQMTGIDDKKPRKPKADDEHKPAKHIEETARLASSVETAKDPRKVRGD
jgi:hypothetical protein